jgi:RimJ/RimL family protein N-acetyltransferase
MLCRYLFTHTAVHRIEAGTQPENAAEQRALRRSASRTKCPAGSRIP